MEALIHPVVITILDVYSFQMSMFHHRPVDPILLNINRIKKKASEH